MSTASPFLFSTDFREDRRARVPAEADVGAARMEAHARGHAEGYAEARAEMEAGLFAVATRVLAETEALMAADEARAAALEGAATELAVIFARRLSSVALAQKPLAEIEAAARQCIIHARTAPHLAIRVAEGMVGEVDRLFARVARETGYAGKVVVLGEPDMAPFQARMEWADGGLVIDPAAREAALDAALARALGTPKITPVNTPAAPQTAPQDNPQDNPQNNPQGGP